MTAPVITVSHVGKRFWQGKSGGFIALRDVSLSIEQGEFVSIIGASGCGKTTLLRMLVGLTPYDTGEIRLRGELVRGIPARVGFVFQAASLMPWRSVFDNVALGLTEAEKSLAARERKARVDAALELTGLEKFAKNFPHEISGGMQQRAGLARALVAEPDILLMDEPLGALDAFTRMRLQEELSSIVGRTGATTVFVTHDVDEAVFLSDRVVVMATGPGRVATEIGVPIERPRARVDMFGDERVALIRDEVLRHATHGLLTSSNAKGRIEAAN